MVLNPDVTVRSRGVMEKCTFCFQKLQAAKLDAKTENRMLKDGDAKTACQMACSAGAIVFGNAHDKDSQLTKIRLDNPQRSFYVLEQLHVLPNITYLAKIRNTEEIITDPHAQGDKTHDVDSKPDSTTLPSSTHPVNTEH
jgi:molybdopterin-containing oxidoreductase family iron-sulfur binding subunit